MTNPIDRGLRAAFREVMAEPHDMTPESSAFPELVVCSEGKHDVEYGKPCARCELECAHGCDQPGGSELQGEAVNMTTRDTRASELAAADWEIEGLIESIERGDGGWVSITTTKGIGFGIPSEFASAPMQKGELVSICGGLGRPIQGVRIGGRLVFFKTKADLEADHQRFLDDLRARRDEEYRQNSDRWRADLDGLPSLLKARMNRFVEEAGGFEPFFKDAGAYELFCCTEAVKFAEYFRPRLAGKTKDEAQQEIDGFKALSPEQQKMLVPFDEGHSGNTFSGAVVLGARVAMGMEV